MEIIINGNISTSATQFANEAGTLRIIASGIVVICNLAEFAATPSEMTGRISYTDDNFRVYVYEISLQLSERFRSEMYIEINLDDREKASVPVD